MILELKGITKSFGIHTVLSDVSFSVDAGEILGFIGPNGAGKTTAIKIILGLLKADGGEVYINGHNIKTEHDEALMRVGGIVESPDLYAYLSGYDNLMQFARIYGLPKERIDEAARIVRLSERIHDKVGTYSLGMRQRLGVAQALMHQPNLLILDEPTNGLDPAGIKELRDILHDCAAGGAAVLVSSHQLAEMELMCNSLCIIEKGHVIAKQAMADFVEGNTAKDIHEYMFEVSDTSLALPAVKELFADAKAENGCIILNIVRDDATAVCRAVIDSGAMIYSVTHKKRSLEDAFLEATTGLGGNVL